MAIQQACTWLDSARVARRKWAQFAYRGYCLASVCAVIGYEFGHHDALDDAKAAAQIILAAVEKTGISLKDWVERAEQHIDFKHQSGRVARDGNPEGALFGETLGFHGSPQDTAINSRRDGRQSRFFGG